MKRRVFWCVKFHLMRHCRRYHFHLAQCISFSFAFSSSFWYCSFTVFRSCGPSVETFRLFGFIFLRCRIEIHNDVDERNVNILPDKKSIQCSRPFWLFLLAFLLSVSMRAPAKKVKIKKERKEKTAKTEVEKAQLRRWFLEFFEMKIETTHHKSTWSTKRNDIKMSRKWTCTSRVPFSLHLAQLVLISTVCESVYCCLYTSITALSDHNLISIQSLWFGRPLQFAQNLCVCLSAWRIICLNQNKNPTE